MVLLLRRRLTGGGTSRGRLPMPALPSRWRRGELFRGALEGLGCQVLELLDLPLCFFFCVRRRRSFF